MRGHNHRHTRLTNAIEQLHDSPTRLWIQITRRLVRQDQSWRIEQGTRNHHTLLLTTRELVRHLIRLLLHTHLLEHVHDIAAHGTFILPARCLQDKQEVLLHIAVAEQLEVLEDHTHLTAQIGYLAATQLKQVIVQGRSHSALHRQFAINGLHQTGLTTTDTAQEIDHLARGDGEIDICQNDLLVLTDFYIPIFNEFTHSASIWLILFSRSVSWLLRVSIFLRISSTSLLACLDLPVKKRILFSAVLISCTRFSYMRMSF